jgi:hypothetical protein
MSLRKASQVALIGWMAVVFARTASADLFNITGVVTSSTNSTFHIGDIGHGLLSTDGTCQLCTTSDPSIFLVAGFVPDSLLSVNFELVGSDFPLNMLVTTGSSGPVAFLFDQNALALNGFLENGITLDRFTFKGSTFDFLPGSITRLTGGGGEVVGTLTITPVPEPTSVVLVLGVVIFSGFMFHQSKLRSLL